MPLLKITCQAIKFINYKKIIKDSKREEAKTLAHVSLELTVFTYLFLHSNQLSQNRESHGAYTENIIRYLGDSDVDHSSLFILVGRVR